MKHSPPHITILVANLPAERDRRVIRECLALEARGYQVTVIAPRGDKSLRILPGSRDTRLRPYPVFVYGQGVITFAVEFGWSFLCVAALLFTEVLQGRAHAVQVCNPPDVYWPLALLMRLLRRPWVFDHHDLCPDVYSTRAGGTPNPWIYRLLVVFEWLTLRTASAVIATNESFRENALRRGVRPDKIAVVRNGPATTEIGSTDSLPTGETETACRTHTVVYLGVLGRQDNVEGAVLAAEELVRIRGRTDWRLVIAGDGETMPALTKLVADRGLGDVVQFAGWLELPEVDALLRTATVAIQPDLPTRMNHLSTMAKTIEYLARGVPVVSADLLETRRSAGDAGLYVPTGLPLEYARAVDALLDDPDARRRMRVSALARFAEQLSWEHQADAYVRHWDGLLARRWRRASSHPAAIPGRQQTVDAVPAPGPVEQS